ncbi:MAG TPA: DUF1028 domain-containing protein [Acidimicrobiia bacterium]|nr:DUF1028 domain-containing protein [Acidimicrobiia bacterium]
MTYSIVARDAATGDLGVAVQTCHFAVGSVVPWARAGVGAVATQAMSEPAYGPRCLDAMARGATAAGALAASLAADPGVALRQVGVIDAQGRADAFTGDLCIDYAGHLAADGYAVQANMMASADVWPAMEGAFESSGGTLAERMLAALVAAEAAGGDARGRMSAALLVVDGTRHDDPQPVAKVDLRVDDHPEPLDALARLVDAQRAFAHFGRGTDALFAGDAAGAFDELEQARAILPDDENFAFAYAGALFFGGRADEARATLHALIAQRPTWMTVVRSFAEKGLLPVPAGTEVDAFLDL